MTEVKIELPDDRSHCGLITDLLHKAGFHELANQIAWQLQKLAVEEPTEFGSVVRAGTVGIPDVRVLWLRSASGYWFSETSHRATFSDLHHPEVLRVGVGAGETA